MTQAMLTDRSKAISSAFARGRQGKHYFDPSQFPEPKFKLFECVLSVFEDVNGTFFADVVQIVGMQVSDPGAPVAEWDYLVQVVGESSESHIEAGHRDLCLERYLRKLDP